MNPTDELDLIRRYQAGDRQAGAALLAAHAGLVYAYARRCFVRAVDPDDVLQEARLGFLRAVDRFDPARAASLATYAVCRIRQRVARYVQDHGSTIRVPVDQQITLRRLRRASEEEREATIAADEHLRAARLALRSLSLDAPAVVRGDGEEALLDTREAEGPTPEEAAIEAEEGRLSDEVQRAWERLTERERDVLRRRCMEGQTLEEVAGTYRLTRERVRQIEAKALHRLRARLGGERAPVGRAAYRRPGRAA